MPKLQKLTSAEANRLRDYCAKNGGQEVVAVKWYTSSSRISRLIAREHAPQKAFRQELIKAGIIKEKVPA